MSLRKPAPRNVTSGATRLSGVMHVGMAMRLQGVLAAGLDSADVGAKRKGQDRVREKTTEMLEFYIEQTERFHRIHVGQSNSVPQKFKEEFDSETKQYEEAVEELYDLQGRLENMSETDSAFTYSEISAGKEGEWIMKQLSDSMAAFVRNILRNVHSEEWP